MLLAAAVCAVAVWAGTILVLVAAGVPVTIGGWGSREGVAAGTAYGVLAAAASLAGAVVLVVGWLADRAEPRGVTTRGVVHG